MPEHIVVGAAEQVEEGDAARERGDYAGAASLYRLAADQGSAIAQSNLGKMYAEGLGVIENRAEAVKWYRRAADQGNAPCLPTHEGDQ